MSLEYTIVCDGCGRLIDASLISFAIARRSVREMGGRVNLPGGNPPDSLAPGRVSWPAMR